MNPGPGVGFSETLLVLLSWDVSQVLFLNNSVMLFQQ